MKTYLKIKISSLAAEARIIRREEQRCPGEHPIRTGLHEHRVLEARREARSALLAYGFLRQRAYRTIEPKCHRAPGWKRTQQLVKKYGDPRSLHRCLPAHRRPGRAPQPALYRGRPPARLGSIVEPDRPDPIYRLTRPTETGEHLDRHQCHGTVERTSSLDLVDRTARPGRQHNAGSSLRIRRHQTRGEAWTAGGLAWIA